jgi:putative flippase GtrA
MIRLQVAIFLVVGSLTVAVDFAVYRGLLAVSVPHDWAKGIGFIAGTIFSYFANRGWTFGGASAGCATALRFSVLYGSTLLVNIYVNSVVLFALRASPFAVGAAFLAATFISAGLNFVGMKFLVFRTPPAKLET